MIFTHFDHQVQPAREQSAALVWERLDALGTNLPVLVPGDFNAPHTNPGHQILVKDEFFNDTWNSLCPVVVGF